MEKGEKMGAGMRGAVEDIGQYLFSLILSRIRNPIKYAAMSTTTMPIYMNYQTKEYK